MAKVAVIGSGVSGLTCAYLLRDKYEVTLYEANDYIGGHTHTHNISIDGINLNVDTGFIVYNDRTYPNFIRLLDELGCTGRPTEMSFSLRDESANLEYNGHNLDTLFAQRRNLVNPRFWWMIRDILRFNKLTKNIQSIDDQTLDQFMAHYRFSKTFKTRYLYPMAAAIWSTGDSSIGQFPIRSLIDFFVNHGLVDLKNRPQWYVVKGGSNQYVKAIEPLLADVRTSTPVHNVSRESGQVKVSSKETTEFYDEVVFACHSDQALSILTDPTDTEKSVLENMRYTPNTAYLHTDQSKLPKRRKAWASWNYTISKGQQADQAQLTYNMNILQHLNSDTQVLVTLNDPSIDPEKILGTFEYSHPYFDQAMVKSQARHAEISGPNHTHFCGAYWSYGFHEDGVRSAQRVCKTLGVNW